MNSYPRLTGILRSRGVLKFDCRLFIGEQRVWGQTVFEPLTPSMVVRFARLTKGLIDVRTVSNQGVTMKESAPHPRFSQSVSKRGTPLTFCP
jgi:hypothetical protein